MRPKDLVLTLAGLLVITLSYLIPFTVLRESSDLSLYLFWLALTVLSFIISLIYLRGDNGG